MAGPYFLPVKNQAFLLAVSLQDMANSGSFKANPTLAAGDVKVDIDGAGFANLGTLPTVTPAAGVRVAITLAAGEMNGDIITITFIDQTNPKEWADQTIVIQTSGATVPVDVQTVKTQAVTCSAGVTVGAFVGNATAALAVDASGRVDLGKWIGVAPNALISGRVDTLSQLRSATTQAGSTSTTIVLDGSASATDHFYDDCWIWDLTTNQVRYVSSYVGATKVATVSLAWQTTPGTGDAFVVWPANMLAANVEFWNDAAVAVPATAGIPDVNVKNIVNVGATLDANNVLNVSAKYWAGTAITATSIPVATAAGAAGGLFIAGSNAATTISGLTTGALACTTITASGAVAFQSTFAVTTSTSLAALSCTTLTASGAVAFQSTFTVTTSTSLAALSCTTLTASGTTSLAAVTTSGTVTLNALTITNATTLTGAVSLGSTLGVTGTTTFAAINTGAIGTGNVTVTGTLSTSGTTTLSALTITNALTVSGTTTLTGNVALAAGLTITQSTLNGNGLSVTGNGTGCGAVFASGSGATGDGVQMTAASTTGNGLILQGTNSGNGLYALGGNGASGDGIHAVGGSGSGDGLHLVAGAAGGSGLYILGNSTAIAAIITGGPVGLGLYGSTNGLLATSTGVGAGVSITTTSGDGVQIAATGGHGVNVTANGTSKHGLFVTGGTAGVSDGAHFVAGTGGVDIRGNLTGNITGSLSGAVGSVTAGVVVTTNNDKTGYSLVSTGLDAVLVAGKTLPAAVKYIGAAVSGVLSGSQTATEVFQDFSGATALTISVDSSGNRSAVVYA